MSKNRSLLYSNYALRGYCLVLWLLGAVVIFHFNSQSQSNGMGGEVNGSVCAGILGHEKGTRNPIFLPDITVYLKNASTSALSHKVQTDLQCLFSIPRCPPEHTYFAMRPRGICQAARQRNLRSRAAQPIQLPY